MDFDTLEPLTPGKAAAVALFLGLMSASFMAWGVVLVRWRMGEPALPPAPPERRTWSRGLTFVAISIVMPLLVVALIAVGEAFLSGKDPAATAMTLKMVQTSCAINGLQILVLILLPALISGSRPGDFGAFAAREDLSCGVLGFVASWLPVCLVNMAVSLFGWREPDGKHPFLQLLDQDSGLATIAWITVSVVILAPLAEELMFRVVLQGWLEQHLPAWAAIGISATAFAAVHTSPGRPDSIPLLPLALILGLVYNRRHSLPAVVLLHALFNGAMLALAVLGGA
jgi:membrane protease YdiL (CAAX protease family)